MHRLKIQQKRNFLQILPFRAISAFGEECAGAVRPIRLYHKEAKNYLGIRTERRTDRNRSTIVAKSKTALKVFQISCTT